MSRPALRRQAASARPALAECNADADATDGTDSSGESDYEEQPQTKSRPQRGKAKTSASPPLDERPRSRYTMQQHSAILESIERKILFQPLAVECIGDLLAELAADTTSFAVGVKARMHTRILSGPSGVGKTEMVHQLRHWLCMGPGDYWEAQFVDIDASECIDQTTINKVIGSGAGYADSDSRHTMVHRLIAACKSPALALAEQLDKKSTAYRAAMRRYKEEGDPPAILLFIDEVDKAHTNFVLAMNGLLDRGTMEASTGGHRFVLPERTHLVIVFTANYGAREIAQMRMPDEVAAKHYVDADMRAHGLAAHSIVRFGTRVIFFRISDEDLRVVIRLKIEQCMKDPREQLIQKYGAVECEQAMQNLTDFVVRITDPECGARGSLKQLEDSLRPMLSSAFRRLEEMPREQFESLMHGGARSALSLFMETLKTELFDDAAQLAEWAESRAPHQLDGRELVRVIQSNKRNDMHLRMHRDGAEQEIHTVGIVRGDRIVTGTVLPLIVVKNQYNITQYGSEDHRQLKDDYRQLHGRYTALRGAVAADDRPLITELMQEDPPKLELSDDDEEDADENVVVGRLPSQLEAIAPELAEPVRKKRKVMVEAVRSVSVAVREPRRDALTDRVRELCDSDAATEETDYDYDDEVQYAAVDAREEKESKRSGLDDEEGDARGRGRPRKQVEGFRFARYENGHAKYVCVKCGLKRDIRYTASHHCQPREDS